MNKQELKEKIKENKNKVIAAAVALLIIIIIIILLLVSCGDKTSGGKGGSTKETAKTEQSGKNNDDKGNKGNEGAKGDDQGGLQVVDPDDEQVIEDSSTDISEYFEDVVETETVKPECKDEKHNVQHVKKVAATTKKAGNIEYWYCKDCKKYFADAACTELISGGKEATVIPKKTETKKEEDTQKEPEIEIEEVEKPEDCVSKEHEVQHVEEKKSTKEEEGNIEYWYCKDCDKYYKDAACTQLIVNGKEDVITPVVPQEVQEDTPGWGRFY